MAPRRQVIVLLAMACFISSSLAFAAGAGMRRWTSTSGKTITARFVKLENGKVHLQKESGKTVRISLRALTDADQAVAKKLGGSSATTTSGRRPKNMPWNLRELSKTPPIHETNVRPARGMRQFFFEGANYKGKPTWVFAYYGVPKGKQKPKGGWPAMVCCPGGGGSAFPDWVRHWQKKGWAVITMDVEGHLPGGNHYGVEGNHPSDKGHQNAGPKRLGWFEDIALPDEEVWFYHAVADVIRANSLLRSFPEINKKQIGLTGISWGGTIVSAVAGIDPRFAFVIPVYGGGFIHKHKMTPAQYSMYMKKWDPSAYLPYAKMPMLWVNGSNEPVFPLDGFSDSAALTAGKSIMCIRPFLPHGHGFGWDEVWEIGGFAGGITSGKNPMSWIGKPRVDPKDGLVHAKYTGKLGGAAVGYSTAGNWKNRILPTIPCKFVEGEIVSTKPLPKGTRHYMIQASGAGPWGGGSHNSVLVKVR